MQKGLLAVLLAFAIVPPAQAQMLDGDWTCRSGGALLGRLLVWGNTYIMQAADGSVLEGGFQRGTTEPTPISGGLLSWGVDGFWPYTSSDDRGSYPTLDLTAQGTSMAVCFETE